MQVDQEARNTTGCFFPEYNTLKLTVEVEKIIEGKDEDPDGVQTDYVLKLVAGACTEEVIMNSEDLRGVSKVS